MKDKQVAARRAAYMSQRQLMWSWHKVLVVILGESAVIVEGKKKSFICFVWCFVKSIQQ